MKGISIFDGWEKKIEHQFCDFEGGFCMQGWIDHVGGDMDAVTERIGRWVQQNLDPPATYQHAKHKFLVMTPAFSPAHAAVWANNECKLDIEGFKMVDLLTQGYVPDEVPEAETVQS